MQANTLLKKLVMDKRGTGSNPTIATECRQERTGPEVWEALHDKTWRRPGEPWMHDDAGADRTWGTSDKFRPRMFVPDAFTGPSSTQQEQRWVHGNLTMPQFHEKMAGTARQLATDSQNILPDTSSEERLAFFRNEVKGALGFVSNEKNLMQALNYLWGAVPEKLDKDQFTQFVPENRNRTLRGCGWPVAVDGKHCGIGRNLRAGRRRHDLSQVSEKSLNSVAVPLMQLCLSAQ